MFYRYYYLLCGYQPECLSLRKTANAFCLSLVGRNCLMFKNIHSLAGRFHKTCCLCVCFTTNRYSFKLEWLFYRWLLTTTEYFVYSSINTKGKSCCCHSRTQIWEYNCMLHSPNGWGKNIEFEHCLKCITNF